MKIETGAEASIFLEDDKIVKRRISKEYRHPELDKKLIRTRTKSEAKLLDKAYPLTPKVFSFDNNQIVMEHIRGEKLKNLIDQNINLASEIGKGLAELHNLNLTHGDLTTNNLVYDENTKNVRFIDFGLGKISTKLEDKATDIHVFKESVNAQHLEKSFEIWNAFINGYNPLNKKDILSRLEMVEQRGKNKKK